MGIGWKNKLLVSVTWSSWKADQLDPMGRQKFENNFCNSYLKFHSRPSVDKFVQRIERTGVGCTKGGQTLFQLLRNGIKKITLSFKFSSSYFERDNVYTVATRNYLR